jgi:hypothetical protein
MVGKEKWGGSTMNSDDMVFKSTVSHWIAGLYWFLLIGIACLFIAISLFQPATRSQPIILLIVYVIVAAILLATLFRGYRLLFILSKDRLIIRGLLMKHEVLYYQIKEVRKIPIPFGFRLYGASFFGGKYYFPGVGTATVAMSNFNDGVLISTTSGRHYVITPQNPESFIERITKHDVVSMSSKESQSSQGL